MSSHEDPCTHEGWECRGGWHECNDCGRGLGSRHNKLEDHAAKTCSLCGPVSQPPDETAVHYGLPPKFLTKDSGERQEYVSGMRRDIQHGKPRFDLLLTDDLPYEEQFLTRFAGLLERGATKYGERNWQLANSAEELARFKASALRHMMQWACGEDDEDHATAVAFNLMAFEYVKWKLDNGPRD